MENSRTDILVDNGGPALSWAAIIAGAFAAMAVTLILFALGNGLGLSAVSPWQNESTSATALTAGVAVWLIVTQWIASGFGGYLSGRLRTKWVDLHSDEVMFRDTTHGLLAWALSTIGMALIVGILAASAINTAGSMMQAAGTGTHHATTSPSDGASLYLVDAMFRPVISGTSTAAPANETGLTGDEAAQAPEMNLSTAPISRMAASPPALQRQQAKTEAMIILAKGLTEGDVSPEDRAYLTQLVSSGTGLSQSEAQARVNQTIATAQDDAAKVRQAADKARKVAATTSLVLALSLVVGAFIASVAGAIGGRQRDTY